MRPFVVYWNNIPAPYMVERFNALADRGCFEFEAWFNDRVEPDRSWRVDESSWRFRYRYLPSTRIAGITLRWPAPIFYRCPPDVLFMLYAESVFVAGWAVAKIRGIKTGFRVLKTYDRWVNRRVVKSLIKQFMFQRADAIETPGEDGRQFALRYGALDSRVYIATHTVDIGLLAKHADRTFPERDELRQRLGVKGFTFIYVGRLWWGKGINYLLGAFERLQQDNTGEVSLLLVGDGPEEAALRRRCEERGIGNVFFAGFQHKPDLPCYYAAADAFVFPTLGDPYGLVVDEAMACGLPVISTSTAGEIRDRVEEGINGYIVPPENDNALAEAMRRLASNPALCERMGRASACKVKDHTPEKWAEDFERIVHALLADEPG